jgi:ABC-type glycerol-3-phosphate transport system substrate-binding protein
MAKKISDSGSPLSPNLGLTRRQITKLAGAASLSIFAPAVHAQGRIRLTYWSRDYNKKDSEAYAAEFMAANPQYSIAVEGLSFTGMWEKVNTALIGGRSADIISAVLTWIPPLAEADLIHPLDTQWMRDVSPADREDYFPSGIELVTYKNRLYGTPWRVDGNLMIWSTDAFREAGLDPNKAPDTWQDLAEYARKLTVRSGNNISRHGLTFSAKPYDILVGWYFLPMLWSFGGELSDDAGSVSRLDERGALDAITYMIDLNRRDQSTTPAIFNYAWSDLSPLVAQKASAMLLGHQANIDIIEKIAPGTSIGVGPLPRGPAGRFTNGSGWCHVVAKTANLEQAWPFLNYLQDPMRQAILTVGAPGRKAGLTNAKYDKLRSNPLTAYGVVSGTDVARSYPLAKSPKLAAVIREMGVPLSNAWEGRINPREAQALMHQKVTEVLKG